MIVAVFLAKVLPNDRLLNLIMQEKLSLKVPRGEGSVFRGHFSQFLS